MGMIVVITGCGYKDAQKADQRVVDQLMAERKAEVNQCFEEAVRRKPSLEGGQMTVRAEQNNDGHLHSTQLIKGFSGSNEVFECVADKVNSWETEPLKTWGSIDLTFEFKNYNQKSAHLNRDFGTAMKEKQPQIGECFRRELARNPKLQGGELRFKFLRTKEGDVRNIEKVRGFSGDQPVFECMEQIVSNMDLGHTAEDSSISWTQNFRRNDALAEQPRSTTEQR